MQVSSNGYIQIGVFEDLNGKCFLTSVKEGKSLDDPVEIDFWSAVAFSGGRYCGYIVIRIKILFWGNNQPYRIKF